MEKQKYSKNYTVICIIFVVALIILGISLTYSFTIADLQGNFTETKIQSGTFKMDTDLPDSNVITANNMVLINEDEIDAKSEKINFTAQVKNESTGFYNIYLKNITISNNMIDSSFKWQLLADDVVVSSGDFSDIITNGKLSTTKTSTETIKYYDTYYLKQAGEFNGASVTNFEIRLYLLNSSLDQSSLIDGTFEASVAITGYL